MVNIPAEGSSFHFTLNNIMAIKPDQKIGTEMTTRDAMVRKVSAREWHS